MIQCNICDMGEEWDVLQTGKGEGEASLMEWK